MYFFKVNYAINIFASGEILVIDGIGESKLI